MSEQTYTIRDGLTGVWNGVYSYPEDLEPGEFTATLLQFGRSLSGTIHEPDVWDHSDGGLLYADVSGRCDGDRVEFAKSYIGVGDWAHTVHYAGTLTDDGLEIEGVWDIPGHWSGRFLMIRAGRDTAEARLVGAEAIER